MGDLYLEIKFGYDSDEDAKKGREEIFNIFSKFFDWFDLLRIHNKVRFGIGCHVRDNFITKIDEIFQNFKNEFPTKWTSIKVEIKAYKCRFAKL